MMGATGCRLKPAQTEMMCGDAALKGASTRVELAFKPESRLTKTEGASAPDKRNV
jgi:hypothetical protein